MKMQVLVCCLCTMQNNICDSPSQCVDHMRYLCYCYCYYCHHHHRFTIMCLKRDGTRAETRFRLSPKRMSPFKSAGASVQSTASSRGVCISVSNTGYTMFRSSEGYWLPTPFASFPFTSPPVHHRVPARFKRTLPLL
jgi:hypothetical protein